MLRQIGSATDFLENMKNIKLEKGLIGKEWWKGANTVHVPGIAGMAPYSQELSDMENEAIMKGWPTVAVIEVKHGAPFQVGFVSKGAMWILKCPIEALDGKFGMRIGDGDVDFFAVDFAAQEVVPLALVEIVRENDPRYANLPLY